MHFEHEAREPLIDALAHGTGARVSAGHNPDHWICYDGFEYIKDFCLHLAAGFFFRIYGRKACFLRRVFHDQRHASANHKRDSSRNPK